MFGIKVARGGGRGGDSGVELQACNLNLSIQEQEAGRLRCQMPVCATQVLVSKTNKNIGGSEDNVQSPHDLCLLLCKYELHQLF